jgi:ribosome-associated toxin RatA of RatAB toxin-antitoxin module
VTVIRKSSLVPYSADEMYALVADIESYGKFLPWCGGTRILKREPETVTATIQIAYRGVHKAFTTGVHKAFTTRNTLEPGRGMDLRLVDGPFRHLLGHWRFEPLDENSCKVSLELDFEFSNRLIALMVGPVFESIANGLVDSFRERAEALYGKRT